MPTMRDILSALKTADQSIGNDLYEIDEHRWIEQQIALIEAGDFDQLDRKNLIQFLTEMTIRDRRELRSRIVVLLMHLLKIQFQPTRLSRSWVNTVVREQDEVRTLLKSIPSLTRYVPEIFDDAYSAAVRQAVSETGMAASAFPATSPWTLEQALAFTPPPVSDMRYDELAEAPHMVRSGQRR
jgi:hypothetical protein